MLQRVLTVAFNAYREAVRARVLWGLVAIAFGVALFSLAVGAFTLEDAPRVVANLGAAAISIFSIAVAILIGATSLQRELEMKTILPLLARPIRRSEYLVGKYLGVMLVVGVFIMAEGGLVLLMSAAMGGRSPFLVAGAAMATIAVSLLAAWRLPRLRTYVPIPWAAAMLVVGAVLCSAAPSSRSLVLASSALTCLEVAIIAGVATLFSSFSTPFLTAIFTLGVLIVGRNADLLARMPERVFGTAVKEVANVLAKVVPNLQLYVPSRPLLTGEAPDADTLAYIGMAAVQSLGWTLGLLAVSAFVFQRRDFL
jgi:ABC-type transport system involved in multi-copper enzyme maturation permease subunit